MRKHKKMVAAAGFEPATCWGALKYEDIKLKDYVSLPQLRRGVQSYVYFYNGRRLGFTWLRRISVYEERCIPDKAP